MNRASMSVTLPLPGLRATCADDVVERLRGGDLDALGEAYDAHHAHVRAFARRLVGDDAAAEDLVQEVFVSLPRVIQRFRGGSALRTFLVAVAVNHARHHVRAAARRRAAMARLTREPPAAGTDPEGQAERGQLAAALVRALDELPLEQRIAFVLCEVEEQSAAEAALAAGVPEATVRTRLFHARRKLRICLSREGLR
jgi:RNA polymerase sigma-70 factor (ECF subfamily)